MRKGCTANCGRTGTGFNKCAGLNLFISAELRGVTMHYTEAKIAQALFQNILRTWYSMARLSSTSARSGHALRLPHMLLPARPDFCFVMIIQRYSSRLLLLLSILSYIMMNKEEPQCIRPARNYLYSIASSSSAESSSTCNDSLLHAPDLHISVLLSQTTSPLCLSFSLDELRLPSYSVG